jgi:hypothetical protein
MEFPRNLSFYEEQIDRILLERRPQIDQRTTTYTIGEDQEAKGMKGRPYKDG